MSGPPSFRASSRAIREYQISVVTPLFGGGVEAGEPDESMPIRGTAIRGQLQFWWRATRGASSATYQDLFARHANVWGTTDKASPVDVDVREVTAPSPQPCARYAERNDGKLQLRWSQPFDGSDRVLPYALFPFQGKLSSDRRTIEEAPAQFLETASFTLRLRYPQALEQDVETAVWAWVNFGGLGARTRRGSGALLCKDLAPKDISDDQRWFRARAVDAPSSARDWPTMPPTVLIRDTPQAAVDAWKTVIGLLQEFRQGVGVARNPGQQANRPGRSRYPEPETIRRVTNRRSQQHGRLADVPDDAFPRAEFGLPIVFHFQGQGEPPETVLYPSDAPSGESRERMASPLILKPLALADGRAVPLILRMHTQPLAAVGLKQGSQSLPLPPTTVTRDARLAAYQNSPLVGAPSGSAIEAFLVYARSKNFREVRR
jgi:CRISPR-associated protein Cmr1